MVSVSLKHVHVVRRKLADGTTKSYHYAWKGKGAPRLVGTPGSAEYLASYQLAYSQRALAGHKGMLVEIVVAYRASPEFRRLSRHTLRAYHTHLEAIEERFGDLPIRALDDFRVRRHFMAWRDSMADHPRTADMAIGVLKRLLAWAEERSIIATNQAKPISRLHSADKSDAIWTSDDLARFRASASRELRWALDLALYTGLRQSDLIDLKRTAFDGSSFVLKTQKRGKEVLIPASPMLKTLLTEIETAKSDRAQLNSQCIAGVVSLREEAVRRARADVILTTQRGGRPWTADGLRSSFEKAKKEAGVKRTFHDLRRTAATGLLVAGVEAPTVALLMGWSERAVEGLKRKYVSRRAIAEAIGAKLGHSAEPRP